METTRSPAKRNTNNDETNANNNTSSHENQNTTPPPPIDTLQAFATQIQAMAQTIANMQQNTMTQSLPPPVDKHEAFMSTEPPTFSHTTEPIEADDWLKTIERKLSIAQCNDREKVLYASGQLYGEALNWWDTFSSEHQDSRSITWKEFKDSFRSHHISAYAMKLKEFLGLTMGAITVSEYRDKFIQLSRYAPNEVDTDEKKQGLFRDGLNDNLQLQLKSHEFSDFEELVDKALVLENTRSEMVDKKRKMAFSEGVDRSYRFGHLSQVEVQYLPEDLYEDPSTDFWPMVNRRDIKASRACFYCKVEEHFISQCPKMRLDRAAKKAQKQNWQGKVFDTQGYME